MVARLIVDSPQSGEWNMAADQVLLETVRPGSPVTLRIYQWSEPTLSIGYFQSHKERAVHPPSASLPWVRRGTGGGAIIHDRELTYSLIVPTVDKRVGESAAMYQLAHRAIAKVLAIFGVEVLRYADSRQSCTSGKRLCSDPWLCFQRRTKEDLVVSGYKICGSAQRRGKNGILQHGSVLLANSPAAPELPGVIELSGRRISYEAIAEAFSSELLCRFSEDNYRYYWKADELNKISELAKFRFFSQDWALKR